MNHYIVTGGAGLIGSNVVAALLRRGERSVTVVDDLNHPDKQANLDRNHPSAYYDKTEFRKAVREGRVAPPDVFIHLGACSSTTEFDTAYLADNNTAYTREMCEWCLANGVRFLYASSAATYGAGERGYDDDDALVPLLRPLNPYGQSKQDFDLWARDNGLFDRIVGLKFFNVFGPGEDHKGAMRSLVHKAYAQIVETGRLRLFRSHRPDYADGCQDRDFVYVGDAVATTLFLADHPRIGGLFNCGTGRARTWLDLAAAVFSAMGREPAVDFVDMPAEIRDKYQYHTQATVERLAATGAPIPATPLETAVAAYIHLWLGRPRDERTLAGATDHTMD